MSIPIYVALGFILTLLYIRLPFIIQPIFCNFSINSAELHVKVVPPCVKQRFEVYSPWNVMTLYTNDHVKISATFINNK